MKKTAENKILWIFAVGQLGWSILSGIIANWMVFFYQPSQEELAKGQIIIYTWSYYTLDTHNLE